MENFFDKFFEPPILYLLVGVSLLFIFFQIKRFIKRGKSKRKPENPSLYAKNWKGRQVTHRW